MLILQIYIGLCLMIAIIVTIGMTTDDIYKSMYNWFQDDLHIENNIHAILCCILMTILIAMVISAVIVLFFGGLCMVIGSIGKMLMGTI